MLLKALLMLQVVCYVAGSSLYVTRLDHTGPLKRATGRIYGGHDATPGQFPYQLSLQVSQLHTRRHNCGGSLVTATSVVTAAHCIKKGVVNYVVAGELSLDVAEGTEQVSRVSNMMAHPKYPGGNVVSGYDIAIFTLSSAFVLNDYVQLIALPDVGSVPVAGSSAFASGWGETPKDIIPEMLQWLEMSIIDFHTCWQIIENSVLPSNFVVDTMFCAGPTKGGKGICVGDSGGPLVQNGTLVGLTSWTVYPCGSVGYPSGFIRVSAFIDFIKENV